MKKDEYLLEEIAVIVIIISCITAIFRGDYLFTIIIGGGALLCLLFYILFDYWDRKK